MGGVFATLSCRLHGLVEVAVHGLTLIWHLWSRMLSLDYQVANPFCP